MDMCRWAMPNATQTWVIIGLSLMFFSMFITVLNYFIKFKKRWHTVVIKKRYPFLVTIINCCVMLALLQRPIQYVIFSSSLFVTNFNLWILYARIGLTSFYLFSHGIVWCFWGRTWLMFYDLKYAQSSLNDKWKAHLDSTLIGKDFWQKYRRTLGSHKYVVIISFVGWFVFAVIAIINQNIRLNTCSCAIQCFSGTAGRFYVGFYLVLVMLYVILYFTTPKIIDIWYLKYELHRFNVLMIALCLSVSILAAISLSIKGQQHQILTYSLVVARISIVGMGIAGIALITTFGVLRKIDYDIKLKKSKKKIVSESNVEVSISEYRNIKLYQILKDETNFTLFMDHLCRECAVELLLCFIELLQFKHLLNDSFNVFTAETQQNNEIDCFDFDSCDLRQNPIIPQSQMVYSSGYDVNDTTSFLKIAYCLYVKYIKMGSELEINISWDLRRPYINYMGHDLDTFLEKRRNVGVNELFELFDDILNEMYTLMVMGPLERFVETEPNIKIAQMLLEIKSTERVKELMEMNDPNVIDNTNQYQGLDSSTN